MGADSKSKRQRWKEITKQSKMSKPCDSCFDPKKGVATGFIYMMNDDGDWEQFSCPKCKGTKEIETYAEFRSEGFDPNLANKMSLNKK